MVKPRNAVTCVFLMGCGGSKARVAAEAGVAEVRHHRGGCLLDFDDAVYSGVSSDRGEHVTPTFRRGL